MTKNKFGGNKHKSQARKFINGDSNKINRLRIVEEDGEFYAQVNKILGGAFCEVQSLKGIPYLCNIGGKFRGKNKSSNRLSKGTWVLVGERTFETTKEGKLPKCDLLEVYSENEKERLKNEEEHINWSIFITNDLNNSNLTMEDNDGTYEFSNQNQSNYSELLQKIEQESKIGGAQNIVLSLSSKNNDNSSNNSDEEFNIDDI
jgi:hypothetical protein